MSVRKVAIGAALVVVGLPVALALIMLAIVSILNRTNGAIVSSNQKREYLLHVPKSYDRTKPAPLIISLHAAAMWPAAQQHTTQWNRLADEHGFIVVYPAGTGVGPRNWHVNRGAGLMKDVRFISELIDTLEAAYNIDPARIYANGLSHGGGMAFVLSCTLSDRIAAVGMVAAAQTLPSSWCTDRRSVPMIAFHGTADPMVPYQGGPSPDPFNPLTFPAVREWAADWARRNRCGLALVESAITKDVTRSEYTHCANDAAVVLYTIEGGGHSWPGGKPMPEWIVGPTSKCVDATERMWAFFREHPLRAK
jgi:polyhydroxybutyrate depolymerase